MLSDECRKKWEEFRKIWNIDKVKNMTLEEYHTAGAKEDCFTWWIEYDGILNKELGKISNPQGAQHYGIYNRKPSKEQKQNNLYIWDREKYGDDKQKAFETIRNNIVKIITYSQNNQLEGIDELECGGKMYKWKIAFCYQKDIDNPQMIPIYKEEILRKIIEEEFGIDTSKIKTGKMSEMYRIIISKKPSNEDIFDYSKMLWEKYGKDFC